MGSIQHVLSTVPDLKTAREKVTYEDSIDIVFARFDVAGECRMVAKRHRRWRD